MNVLVRSFTASFGTSFCSEVLKIALLYADMDPDDVLLVSIAVSFVMIYTVQFHIFGAKDFYGITLLKYTAVVIFLSSLAALILDYLQGHPNILRLRDKYAGSDENRQKIADYILINLALFLVNSVLGLLTRRYFTYVKTPYDWLGTAGLLLAGFKLWSIKK